MKEDCDEFVDREETKKLILQETSKGNVNSLLSEVLEQGEEIELYKSRLKELETAFYYNLELITERDLELTMLEKQLATESEKLQAVSRERHELEDLVKIIDEKSHRKVQQLEAKLSLKEGEIKELQSDHLANISTLKTLIDDIKQQQEKKIYKMSMKFQSEKSELVNRYQKEIEEKERYYLLEIDNLAGKLEQVCRERENLAGTKEENRNLKRHLQDAERHFAEKENHYLEEIRKMSKSSKEKFTREVQCNFKPEGVEKKIQVRPDVVAVDAQTTLLVCDLEEQYLRRINFLQEQNEVLKHVVKDLKRNRDAEPRDPGQAPGCECSAVRTEIEQVTKVFQNEINNLKKILQEELKQREEEDAVIQSLEASVTCLKEKLVLRLQKKFNDFEERDVSTCTYNREMRNEIQVQHLEQKLSNKIDSLVTATEGERQNLHEKLEELKMECMDKIETLIKLQERSRDFKREDFLENIRTEKRKLEKEIEGSAVIAAGRDEKRQTLQREVEFPEGTGGLLCGPVFAEVGSQAEGCFPLPGSSFKDQGRRIRL